VLGIKSREHKKRTARKPLLLLAPLLGIGAYLVYSRAKTAKAPEYDPSWQWPEQSTSTITPYPASAPGLRRDDPALSPDAVSVPPESKAVPLVNKQVLDLNGESIGEVKAVYYRSLTGDPEWLAVSTGLVDLQRVLVPLDGATVDEETIRLAQAKGVVEDAPAVEEQVLSEATEMRLYSHYGVRRTLPGVESERDSENVLLRAWQPTSTLEPS
jgi:hypothetical protein